MEKQLRCTVADAAGGAAGAPCGGGGGDAAAPADEGAAATPAGSDDVRADDDDDPSGTGAPPPADGVGAPGPSTAMPRAWRRAMRVTVTRARRDAAAGPSGLPPAVVIASLRDNATLRQFAELTWGWRHAPPAWLCASRAIVHGTVKVSAGTAERKLRALCIGEALWRIVEATWLRACGRRVWAHCAHSIAGVKGGAATAGAVLAALARHGHIVASADVAGAFDVSRHEDVLRALEEAGAAKKLVRFVGANMACRRVRHRGRRLVLTDGLGLGQGSSLSPMLFAAIAEGAARACRLRGDTFVVYWADNFFVVGTDAAAVKATLEDLVAALDARGLSVGDSFVCAPDGMHAAADALVARDDGAAGERPAWDCGHGVRAPLVTPADAEAVFLGISASAAGARARIAKLEREVALTADLSALAAVVILRGSTLPAMAWLALCPEVAVEVAAMHAGTVTGLAVRCATGGLVWPVEQVADGGGLGLMRPDAAAAAAARGVVVNALDTQWPLRHAAWVLARVAAGAEPGAAFDGDFVGAVHVAMNGTDFAVDVEAETIRWQCGQQIARAPPVRRSAAIAALSLGMPRAVERPQTQGAVPRADGPLAALLCADGTALPRIDDAAMQAAVGLYAGVVPLVDGGGELCPCCGNEVGVQHHHHCPATTMVARDAVHVAVQRWLVELFRLAGVAVEFEVRVAAGDGVLRIDIVLDGRLFVEIKTLALYAPSRARTTLGELEAGLTHSVAAKYGAEMRLLALSRDGRITPHGLSVLAEMQDVLDAAADPDGPPRPSVLAAVGAAVAEAEAAVVACWRERAAAAREAAGVVAGAVGTDVSVTA